MPVGERDRGTGPVAGRQLRLDVVDDDGVQLVGVDRAAGVHAVVPLADGDRQQDVVGAEAGLLRGLRDPLLAVHAVEAE